jgi:hypothetical protein
MGIGAYWAHCKYTWTSPVTRGEFRAHVVEFIPGTFSPLALLVQGFTFGIWMMLCVFP